MRFRLTSLFGVLCLILCACPLEAQEQKRLITEKIDESKLATLGGNTTPAAARADFDRGAVPDDTRFEHLLLLLKRDPDTEARVKQQIDAMHDPASPQFHRWLTAEQFGARFGVHPQDSEAIQEWLKSHGFTVNQAYKNGLLLDIAGSAKQIRDTFHTEMHNLVLPNGDKHIANIRDPQVPAALAPAIEGMPLHDFFRRPRVTKMKPVSFNHDSGKWQPHFTLPFDGVDLFVVAPFDFATIYNLTPLWNQGFTGKGVTIATVEDTNLAHPSDWSTFRKTFGLDAFKQGNFRQIYPGCKNPGQNGDEIEAALDVEWASAAAPDANVELFACPDTQTTSGLDTAIVNLLETDPPDIISDSYGLCETVSGQAEVALENFEAELATIEGVTFFIAQGDTGADECAPVESTNYSTLGINSGDNTATAFAVDVGGTDFMAQYNQDANGVPISNYWNAKNNPTTLASARSYIPEIPWNDGCTSQLIYSDPVNGGFTQSYGANGFCNSTLGQSFVLDVAGGGGPSTCFTGKPSIPGVVSGTCKGNPKPLYQFGVQGVPDDGLRDQPDVSLFASNGAWGSFYLECMSDTAQGGAVCTVRNDAVVQGGGGTSFSAPAMAGIQALINQKFGRQGDANYVYYALAHQQFAQRNPASCDASKPNGTLPAANCVFHDITRGDMDIPCGQNSDGHFYDCFGASGSTIIGELSNSNSKNSPAYPATPGYDLATGLGSVDATNLFNAWPQPH